jgi:hypothetical protein
MDLSIKEKWLIYFLKKILEILFVYTVVIFLYYMGFKIGCQPPFCKLSNIFYRFTALRFQEGGINVSKRVKHMMIAHVVSAFCNYIFLRTYGWCFNRYDEHLSHRWPTYLHHEWAVI